MKKLFSFLFVALFACVISFSSGAFNDASVIGGAEATPVEASEVMNMDEDGRDSVVVVTTSDGILIVIVTR
ncbi:MAG: hypothetical protein WBA74_24415 [Cyclobacteriaceae bacterium]